MGPMREKRAGVSTFVAAMFLAVLCFAPSADAFIYWANGATIGRVNNDGSTANPNFITGQLEPCGLAVDSQHIYWANQAGGSIGRANLDGTGVNPNFITTNEMPCGVTLDGTHIWWTNQATSFANTGSVARANLDGSNPQVVFSTSAFVENPRGVGVGSDLVLWSNRSASPPSIGRAGVDGTPPPDKSFITTPVGSVPTWPTVGGGRVYFATVVGMSSFDLEGGSGLGSGIDAYGGIAIFGGKVYWANSTEGTVGRANLDMSSPEFAFIKDLGNPRGLAVDGGIPSNEFTTKVKRRKLIVSVKAPGTVSVSDAAAKKGTASVAAKKPRLLKSSSGSGGPPTIVVKLKLTKVASQTLTRKGKVKVRARITFTPEGAVANTRTSKLKLKSKRK
jgi:Low-density lipoprotein receptor repeat class B